MTSINFDEIAWKDRSTLCAIVGGLICVLGLSSFGFAPLMMLSVFMGNTSAAMPPGTTASPTLNDPASPMMIIYLALVALCGCVVPGVFWLWCGVGAIKRRKYARKLLAGATLAWAILGGLYLILVMTVFVMMMNTMAVAAGAGAGTVMAVVMLIYGVVLFVFLVLVPSLLAYFFTRRSVWHTFEFYDQQPSWTDPVPVKLLAFTLPFIWMGLCGLPYVLFMFMPEASELIPMPMVSGGAWLGISLLLLGAAVSMHTLKPVTWWIMLIACLAAFAFSVPMSMSVGDMTTANLSAEEAEEMEWLFKFLSPESLITISVLFWGAILAYLMFLKSTFMPSSREDRLPPHAASA
jgi:hypothetical protein